MHNSLYMLRYHRNKYRSLYDRYSTSQAYKHHLKLMQTMSQYPRYNLTNPISKSLHDYNNYSKMSQLHPTYSLSAQCQNLPFYSKFKKLKPMKINDEQTKSNKHSAKPNTYLQNILQETIKSAIYICKIIIIVVIFGKLIFLSLLCIQIINLFTPTSLVGNHPIQFILATTRTMEYYDTTERNTKKLMNVLLIFINSL